MGNSAMLLMGSQVMEDLLDFPVCSFFFLFLQNDDKGERKHVKQWLLVGG